MSITVEVSLRIPSLTVKTSDQPDRVINNTDIRFAKLINVAAIPKVGSRLDIAVKPDVILQCTVTRADWEEERALFVVSCQCRPTKGAASGNYFALMNDPDWSRKQFP
jgi:hypothetical protein